MKSASRCTVGRGARPGHRPTHLAYDLGFIIVSDSIDVRPRKGPLLLAESVGGADGPQAGRTLRLANVPVWRRW